MTYKKRKLILRFNSHSLSDFQDCGMKYKLANIECLEPQQIYAPFTKGELVHKLLGHYDLLRHRDGKSHAEAFVTLDPFFQRLCKQDPFKKLERDDKILVWTTYQQYLEHYKHDQRKVLGIEVGFSKVFYEDKNFIFIAEGSIDVLSKYKIGIDYYILPFDRKTRGRNDDLYPFTNQFILYCWAVGSTQFIIDYIGYQQSLKPEEKFVRKIHKISKDQIEQWRQDTIWWCFQLLAASKSGVFMRNRASCSGKYGACRYHEICETTNQKQRDWIKRRSFVKTEPHISWKIEDQLIDITREIK